jgi:hypothetical protein
LDILTNETAVYKSKYKAAHAIGCSTTAISKAIKFEKENGVSRPIKKRFQVKLI